MKKISTYITKKVAARLEEISKKDAKNFEEKWNDIKIFIEYGMLSDEKFCEQAMKFALLEDTDGKYFNLEDYKKLIEANQTDKNGNLIYLYATDKEAQYPYIKAAGDKGYDVLMMGGQLDIPFVGMLEQKNEKSHFVRVDSDVLDNLIKKEDQQKDNFSEKEKDMASILFKSQIPAIEKSEFYVTYAPLSQDDQPIIITQSEYMRRMKEMAQFQPGMNFYGELPSTYNLTLNTNHSLIKKIVENATSTLGEDVKKLDAELEVVNAGIKAINDLDKDHKGVPEDKKPELEEKEKQAKELRDKKEEVIGSYAAGQDTIKQLIDIALLGNGLLKGEALNKFLKRSVSLL